MIVSTGLNLKFVGIINRGEIATERVHLQATRDGNTTYFILLATIAVTPNEIRAGSRAAYWFEPTDVKEDDHIIVYTKAGEYSKAPRKDGHFNHFFYWGRTTPLFGNSSARVVVAELNTWETGGA